MESYEKERGGRNTVERHRQGRKHTATLHFNVKKVRDRMRQNPKRSIRKMDKDLYLS